MLCVEIKVHVITILAYCIEFGYSNTEQYFLFFFYFLIKRVVSVSKYSIYCKKER